MARNPFRVETTIAYRSPLPVSAFQAETEQLFGPTLPNDCIVELLDESGRTAQRLYGRMVFVSLPQATARVQTQETDGGTLLTVTYVMPILEVLFHRTMEVFCTIFGFAHLLWWLWVIRHGWGSLSHGWRTTLVMGTLIWAAFSVSTFVSLPLSGYPSKLSVWLEDVGKLEQLPEATN